MGFKDDLHAGRLKYQISNLESNFDSISNIPNFFNQVVKLAFEFLSNKNSCLQRDSYFLVQSTKLCYSKLWLYFFSKTYWSAISPSGLLPLASNW